MYKRNAQGTLYQNDSQCTQSWIYFFAAHFQTRVCVCLYCSACFVFRQPNQIVARDCLAAILQRCPFSFSVPLEPEKYRTQRNTTNEHSRNAQIQLRKSHTMIGRGYALCCVCLRKVDPRSLRSRSLPMRGANGLRSRRGNKTRYGNFRNLKLWKIEAFGNFTFWKFDAYRES